MTEKERKSIEQDIANYEQQLREYRQAATRLEGVIIYLRQKLEEKEAPDGGQET